MGFNLSTPKKLEYKPNLPDYKDLSQIPDERLKDTLVQLRREAYKIGTTPELIVHEAPMKIWNWSALSYIGSHRDRLEFELTDKYLTTLEKYTRYLEKQAHPNISDEDLYESWGYDLNKEKGVWLKYIKEKWEIEP